MVLKNLMNEIKYNSLKAAYLKQLNRQYWKTTQSDKNMRQTMKQNKDKLQTYGTPLIEYIFILW